MKGRWVWRGIDWERLGLGRLDLGRLDLGRLGLGRLRPGPGGLGRWGLLWLQFTGFFLAALIIWSAIVSEQRAVTQRALELPLAVTGLGPERVAPGVPERVVVVVSGLSDTVERLRPEYFDAFIDLREVTAEFDVGVRVGAPQGIEVLDVSPGRIIGITEAIASRTVPLRLSVASVGSGTDGLRMRAQPGEVRVSGQESEVARASYVTAVVTPSEDGLQRVGNLFAVGEDGLPLADLRVTPDEVMVSSERETLLYSRRLPVAFEPLVPPPYEIGEVRLSHEALLVAGPREAVTPLEQVALQAELPPESGQHELELVPVLPEGVVALERVRAQVALHDPSPEPDADPSPAAPFGRTSPQ